MYIGEILRKGTQNLSYIRWSLMGFCVILYTSGIDRTGIHMPCLCPGLNGCVFLQKYISVNSGATK